MQRRIRDSARLSKDTASFVCIVNDRPGYWISVITSISEHHDNGKNQIKIVVNIYIHFNSSITVCINLVYRESKGNSRHVCWQVSLTLGTSKHWRARRVNSALHSTVASNYGAIIGMFVIPAITKHADQMPLTVSLPDIQRPWITTFDLIFSFSSCLL